jgi:GTP-binding protein
VSKTPGKTRGIYIYETGQGHDFADLPGTGYARVSREERSGWAELAECFFGSGAVALAVHLIDPRVGDARTDLAMRDYLADHGVEALPVATKWDRLTAAERARARLRIEVTHGSFVAVSARTGEGMEILWREIRRRLGKGGKGTHG